MANVRKSISGDILDVRLRQESDGAWVYDEDNLRGEAVFTV